MKKMLAAVGAVIAGLISRHYSKKHAKKYAVNNAGIGAYAVEGQKLSGKDIKVIAKVLRIDGNVFEVMRVHRSGFGLDEIHLKSRDAQSVRFVFVRQNIEAANLAGSWRIYEGDTDGPERSDLEFRSYQDRIRTRMKNAVRPGSKITKY